MAALDDLPRRNRRVYALFDALLTRQQRQGVGAFLNWGYRPLPGQADWSPHPGEDEQVNGDHIRLVREVIGAEQLTGKDVLDLGCGRGGTLKIIETDHRPRRLIGADLSPENVEAARRLLAALPSRALSRRVQIVDACLLPYPPASFDAVLNLESSGAYADQVAFLRQVATVLRPGGRFLFADLLPAALIPPLQQVASAFGMTCIRERSISAQVLAARERAEPIEQRLYGEAAIAAVDDEGLLSEFLAQYRAGRDSAMQAAMRSGALSYHVLHFERRAGPDEEPSAEHIAALRQRQHLLDAQLQDRDRSSASGPSATRPAAASPWLPFHVQTDSSRANDPVRIFCLPFAGGSASYYRRWVPYPDHGIAFCPVELPGRGARMAEPFAEDLDALVAALAEALLPHMEGSPFALFGHSFGALCAFLLAERLERSHLLSPVHLFVSGRHAPHRPGPGHQRHRLSDRDLAAELVVLGGTAPEILDNADLVRLSLPAMRADLRLTETYRRDGVGGRLAVPLTAFVGSDDAEVSVEEMRHWLALTAGSARLEVLPGEHFYLNDPAIRARLIEQIGTTLAR